MRKPKLFGRSVRQQVDSMATLLPQIHLQAYRATWPDDAVSPPEYGETVRLIITARVTRVALEEEPFSDGQHGREHITVTPVRIDIAEEFDPTETGTANGMV
jgi:hypothetical protein